MVSRLRCSREICRILSPLYSGPSHYWLNKHEKTKVPFKRDGLFLVLVGAFLGESLKLQCDHVLMFERVKLLQRRYPQLHVFGFQADSSICLATSQPFLIQIIMAEYITFPVLLSKKSFTKIGSIPEFEDGGFELSKLLRPADSLYNADDDCLYFVDSEAAFQ